MYNSKKVINYFKNLINNNKMFSNIILDTNDINFTEEIIFEIIEHKFNYEKILFNTIENDTSLYFLGNSEDWITIKDINNFLYNVSFSNLTDNKFKFVIIKTAELLKEQSANALLKFLEEKDENIFVFLISKNPSKILPTIKSRCQLFKVNVDESEINNKYSEYEKIFIEKNKYEIMLLARKFQKLETTEIISILEKIYKNIFIINNMYLAELTIKLINDINKFPNKNIIINEYLIDVVENI